MATSIGGLIALVFEASLSEVITTSTTLRVCLSLGAIFGGIWGFRQTALKFKGKGRPTCVRAGLIYLAMWVFCLFVLVIGPIVVLRPAFAEKYQFARSLRELLLNAMPWTNVFEFFAAFFAAYFLVGSIVLSSPKLASPRGS